MIDSGPSVIPSANGIIGTTMVFSPGRKVIESGIAA